MSATSAVRLMVVDDDRNHREMLRALLEEWGYDPVTVTMGKRPWPCARKTPLTSSSWT